MTAQGASPQDQSNAKVPEQFVVDPFAADINPGSIRGQKLFTEACAALEDAKKLTASVDNQHVIMQKITDLAQKSKSWPFLFQVI